MRIVPLKRIQAAIDMPASIAAVRDAFIAFADGRIGQPDPMQILFHDAAGTSPAPLIGDCHVKAAQAADLPCFVIKVATGFYQNEARGLPTNNGAILVLSSQTGAPLALMQDNGWLTAMRTAAAGALAAALVPTQLADALGVVGTGLQARLQARAIASHLGISQVFVYGRAAERAAALCDDLGRFGLSAEPVPDVTTLCRNCRIVVTTTPAAEPVLWASDISPANPTHIIAVGADSPGKSEIDPEIFRQASAVVTDSHDQALNHGDFGVAVRAGAIGADADLALGRLIAGSDLLSLPSDGISIVDLTGLGAQDLYITNTLMHRLNESGAGI